MEPLINYIAEAFVYFLEIYIIYRYMTIFFDNHYVDKKLTFIAYMTRCVLSFTFRSIEISPALSAILSVASVFLIALSYSANISKKIVVTIMVYMCGFIAEAVVAIVIGLSSFDIFGQTVHVDVFSKVIIQFIFWLITIGIQKFKNVGENIPIPKAFIIAIIVITCSFVYLEIIVFQQQDMDSNMAGVSLVCMLVSNFILIYLYDSLAKMFMERTQAAIIEKEIDYYHEQSELLKRNHEELKKFRHDIKNRIVVIQQMLLEKKYDGVLEYTEQFAEKLTKMQVYSNTGNIAIDGVINYKLTRACEKGVVVKANIEIPENIAIEEDDIVVILGNILDNAVEATDYMQQEKYICFNLEYDRGNIFIHIKNSYDSFVQQVNGKYITRKGDKHLHGVGLQSVNSIVQKYNGSLEIESDEKEFTVDILLYT